MTKNEAAALRTAKRYRRQMDELEDETAKLLASSFTVLMDQVRADLEALRKDDPRGLPLNVRYSLDIAPVIDRRLSAYTAKADRQFVSLTKKAGRLGVNAADEEARQVTPKSRQTWQRVDIAGLFTGGIFQASREALQKIPSAISGKISDLVTQAVGMAEQGLDWLMGQIGNVLSDAWRSFQRVIRTAAEQMFRRAQQEQRQQMPVQSWRRCANHETACFACLMLEGHIYDREEDFSDHPNGRCYIVPAENGAQDTHEGRKWFEEQDEETQRRILGKTKWEAWQNGDVDLDKMAELRWDPEYGLQPHTLTLKELGLEPAK